MPSSSSKSSIAHTIPLVRWPYISPSPKYLSLGYKRVQFSYRTSSHPSGFYQLSLSIYWVGGPRIVQPGFRIVVTRQEGKGKITLPELPSDKRKGPHDNTWVNITTWYNHPTRNGTGKVSHTRFSYISTQYPPGEVSSPYPVSEVETIVPKGLVLLYGSVLVLPVRYPV